MEVGVLSDWIAHKVSKHGIRVMKPGENVWTKTINVYPKYGHPIKRHDLWQTGRRSSRELPQSVKGIKLDIAVSFESKKLEIIREAHDLKHRLIWPLDWTVKWFSGFPPAQGSARRKPTCSREGCFSLAVGTEPLCKNLILSRFLC